jgi:hypothetical protein
MDTDNADQISHGHTRIGTVTDGHGQHGSDRHGQNTDILGSDWSRNERGVTGSPGLTTNLGNAGNLGNVGNSGNPDNGHEKDGKEVQARREPADL